MKPEGARNAASTIHRWIVFSPLSVGRHDLQPFLLRVLALGSPWRLCRTHSAPAANLVQRSVVVVGCTTLVQSNGSREVRSWRVSLACGIRPRLRVNNAQAAPPLTYLKSSEGRLTAGTRDRLADGIRPGSRSASASPDAGSRATDSSLGIGTVLGGRSARAGLSDHRDQCRLIAAKPTSWAFRLQRADREHISSVPITSFPRRRCTVSLR